MGIYTIHQPNDSVGTAPSHRNTQRSFPRKRESSIDAGYLDSRLRGNDDLFEMCRYPCPAGEGGQNRSFAGSGKGVRAAYRVEKCAHGSGKILKVVPLGSEPHGTVLSVNSVATQVSSPDGAERNPGMDGAVGGLPRISLSLHAGYSSLLSPPGAVSSIKGA